MAHTYVTKGGWYNIYSSITDSFLFPNGITLDDLREWVRDQRGLLGLQMFERNSLPKLSESKHYGHIHVPEGMTYDQYIEKFTLIENSEEAGFNILDHKWCDESISVDKILETDKVNIEFDSTCQHTWIARKDSIALAKYFGHYKEPDDE